MTQKIDELEKKGKVPPQTQDRQPGTTQDMDPRPLDAMRYYKPAGKLIGKVGLITGGDSGIGKAVAIGFAKEGAQVAIVYLNEHEDASETKKLIEQVGSTALLIPGDIGDESFCKEAVQQTIQHFGKLDIVVNNAAEQHPQEHIEQITVEQLEKTFRTNIFSIFYIVKAAMPYLKEQAAIINTTSVTAYRGSPKLLDYSSTKGAIVAFTRSLALNLAEKKIRVNAVAPGPIWTPLIPSTFPEEKVESFGQQTAMKRTGQPDEVAPCFIFLASDDSSYMTGQVLHPNGGDIING
jgi:NAD(P)-dependent dehydrogenase (short-subunit alcohol dehydrogenase family)